MIVVVVVVVVILVSIVLIVGIINIEHSPTVGLINCSIFGHKVDWK